jgi:hypothetical protein
MQNFGKLHLGNRTIRALHQLNRSEADSSELYLQRLHPFREDSSHYNLYMSSSFRMIWSTLSLYRIVKVTVLELSKPQCQDGLLSLRKPEDVSSLFRATEHNFR